MCKIKQWREQIKELIEPEPEQFGYNSNNSHEWLFGGGDIEYYKALKRYNFMIENGLGEEDMINDITLPHEIN